MIKKLLATKIKKIYFESTHAIYNIFLQDVIRFRLPGESLTVAA